ncbi:adenosylcobinamide-GDP ribazoletransferase [Pseudooceanicola sp. LIPI14-2-Ac024]|uniref:adenosylcobinamide-GDP ribazoletransferase n=1 Tax=Pseudooceanicola sp. LIPI14-2-Ac024 TaxID=3344875 RepID=UPI0035D05840
MTDQTTPPHDAPAPRDILAALALLSRLPLPRTSEVRSGAAWAYPLAGVVLGALVAAAAGGMLLIGLPVSLAALIALAVAVILTGAMHEDGLADVADGFWGGWTRDRRLEIMRDSHIGTYGVTALALSLAARWQALVLILAAGQHWSALIAAAALSRAAMPAVMCALPHARADGLSHHVGRPPTSRAVAAAVIAVVLAVILLPITTALAASLMAALTTAGLAALARHKIGGQTGDVLGATQQLAEIAVLCAIVA